MLSKEDFVNNINSINKQNTQKCQLCGVNIPSNEPHLFIPAVGYFCSNCSLYINSIANQKLERERSKSYKIRHILHDWIPTIILVILMIGVCLIYNYFNK